jgi:hypothetical protein
MDTIGGETVVPEQVWLLAPFLARRDAQFEKHIQILFNNSMQTRHQLLVLELTREKAAFVIIRSRLAWSIPPVHLHLHTILLVLVYYLIHVGRKGTWI